MDFNIEIFGRKTFFIAADASLVPESYVKEFLEDGYETYIINDDYRCDLRKKVELIISGFPGAILLFNIDAEVEGIDWPEYIKELVGARKNEVLYGILHLKQSSKKNMEITDYYTRTLNLSCGCVPLQAHHHENFATLEKVLAKAGAKGRRSLIRANCDESSEFRFMFKSRTYHARLLDVNIGHFACTFENQPEGMAIFDKIRDASVTVNGMRFGSDVVLLMKRNKMGENVYIFMFIMPPDDEAGLPEKQKDKLIHKIYQMVTGETMTKLEGLFDSADNE